MRVYGLGSFFSVKLWYGKHGYIGFYLQKFRAPNLIGNLKTGKTIVILYFKIKWDDLVTTKYNYRRRFQNIEDWFMIGNNMGMVRDWIAICNSARIY